MVNVALLLNASPFIKVHLVMAVMAFFLGAWQLFGRKGTALHKTLGKAWVAMMFIVSLSSFWIKELMPGSVAWGFSPIHLLSLLVITQIALGLYFARVGNIVGHQRCMTYTYVGGLIIAGVFTFLPGRLLYEAFVASL
jgi:uncharacterized membrane protein